MQGSACAHRAGVFVLMFVVSWVHVGGMRGTWGPIFLGLAASHQQVVMSICLLVSLQEWYNGSRDTSIVKEIVALFSIPKRLCNYE